MSVYAISDLHLALSVDKPMDVFGKKWDNYMERLQQNWNKHISKDDYVIMPGDLSWATYIEDAHLDFDFIHKLNGKKIISKGNHDYWWTTMSKLEKYVDKNDFSSIQFINNSSVQVEDLVICATRGWKCPNDEDFTKEDEKIYAREVQRLKLSLESAKDKEGKKFVMIHFPPFNSKKEMNELIELMNMYGVENCLYGHLHGISLKNPFEGNLYGVNFRLISADYLKFMPIKIN